MREGGEFFENKNVNGRTHTMHLSAIGQSVINQVERIHRHSSEHNRSISMNQNSWETTKRILTVHRVRSNVVRAEGYVLNRRDTGWNRHGK